MSVLKNDNDFLIFSHNLLLNNVFKKVDLNGVLFNFEIRPEFFNVSKPFKNKKRSQDNMHFNEETIFVQKRYEKIKNELQSYEILKSNTDPKAAADHFYKEDKGRKFSEAFKGGNNSHSCIVAAINDEKYILPPSSYFYNYDVRDIKNHVSGLYDFILLDPPWWNKYIRRKRARNSDEGYRMMWNKELAEIPIGDFLATDGLIAAWCTNAQSHIDSLKNEIFPKWGVQLVSQWYWLKVTTTGEVTTPFSPLNGKQPFERIIFGVRDLERRLPSPESGKIIVSVPSALHSHKPPLCDVLKPYLPTNPKSLEVFARYLLPNFTSYGNEVLKLQHISLFNKIPVES